MQIQILTQEKLVSQQEADSVTIPTEEGEITVMPGHISVFARLKAGQMTIRQGKDAEILAVIGGFVDIGPQTIKILADTAIRAADIDEAQAKQAIEAAKRAMSEQQSEVDFVQATRDLGRAMLELETATRWRKLKNLP